MLISFNCSCSEIWLIWLGMWSAKIKPTQLETNTLLCCGGAQSRLKGLPMCLWRSNLFYWTMRYKTIIFSFEMLHLFPVFHQKHFCLALLVFWVFLTPQYVFLYVAAKFSSFYKTTSLEYLMKKHLRAYGQNASLMQSSKDSTFSHRTAATVLH